MKTALVIWLIVVVGLWFHIDNQPEPPPTQDFTTASIAGGPVFDQ